MTDIEQLIDGIIKELNNVVISSKTELRNYLNWADRIFEDWTQRLIDEMENLDDPEMTDMVADIIKDNNAYVTRIKDTILEIYGR